MSFPTRAEVEAMIAERIADDPSYRDALMADPRGTISDLVGIPLPETVSIELHEESLTTIHLTIPASDSLADEDLELVAGGWTPSGHISTCGPNCGMG